MATSPFNLATPDSVATPFLANNGNPNTVYNTAATPMQSFGNQPLMHNAAAVGATLPQPWASTPVFSPGSTVAPPSAQLHPGSAFAAPAAQFWRNFSGAQRPVFDLSTSGVTNPNDAWAPLIPETPAVVTPPPATVTPPPLPAGGGIGGAEGNNGGRDGGLGGFTFGGLRQDGTSTVTDSSGNTYTSRPIESITNGLQGLVSQAASGLGFNGRDGNFDFNQFVDAVSEVLLPGDLYNANVGRWNGLNAATAVLNSVVPGLGRVAQWLIDKLPQGNPLRSWLQQNIVQNNVDRAYEEINEAPQNDPFSGGSDRGPGGGLNFLNPIGIGGGSGGRWMNGNVVVGDVQNA